MIRLNGQVHDSKRGEGRHREATPKFREDPRSAKRGKLSHHPHGDVDWVATVVNRSLPMRHAGEESSRFAVRHRVCVHPNT